MKKVLIVEDDVAFIKILDVFLTKNNYKIESATSLADGRELLDKTDYDLYLFDYKLPDGTGLDLLAYSRSKGIRIPTIIMTGFKEIRLAVKAIQSGAFDYITKPINPDELLLIMKQALEVKEPVLVEESVDTTPIGFVTGESTESLKLHEYIRLVAPTDMSVIIEGESGTGKENVARSIHSNSKRSNKSFVTIDCGVLSKDLAASELFGHVKGAFTGALQDKKGQFEVANGGTFFLDEVGNLSYEVQIQLLRAIQEKVIQPVGSQTPISIDVRIITATNDQLLKSVEKGLFREDLYHRLNEFKIKVPPLKKRGEDLHLFIKHFIDEANKDLEKTVQSISSEAESIFKIYDWPGNLRELRNVIRRMVLLSSNTVLDVNLLPEDMILALQREQESQVETGTDLKAIQEHNEKEMIVKALKEVKYNKSKAAKLLNIDRKTLYNKLERYQIEG